MSLFIAVAAKYWPVVGLRAIHGDMSRFAAFETRTIEANP